MKPSLVILFLLILYLASGSVSEVQAIEADSAAHFGASFVLASTCHVLMRKFSTWNSFARHATCMLVTGTIGAGKEFYDHRSGRKFSNKDLGYDMLGSSAASALFFTDEYFTTQPALDATYESAD